MVCMVSVEGKQHLQKMCYYYSVSITITVLVLASIMHQGNTKIAQHALKYQC